MGTERGPSRAKSQAERSAALSEPKASEEGRIELRAARAGDASELARLAAAVLPEAWTAASFAAALTRETTRALVAEDDAGARVGFALALRAANDAELVTVAVEPAQQGRGLGRRLVAVLLSQLRDDDGVGHVYLEVRASNAPALALYKSLGFTESRRRVGYYRDGEDALELGVAL